eukprot:1751216-Pleurochrysis_carterae.AAC.1
MRGGTLPSPIAAFRHPSMMQAISPGESASSFTSPSIVCMPARSLSSAGSLNKEQQHVWPEKQEGGDTAVAILARGMAFRSIRLEFFDEVTPSRHISEASFVQFSACSLLKASDHSQTQLGVRWTACAARLHATSKFRAARSTSSLLFASDTTVDESEPAPSARDSAPARGGWGRMAAPAPAPVGHVRATGPCGCGGACEHVHAEARAREAANL